MQEKVGRQDSAVAEHFVLQRGIQNAYVAFQTNLSNTNKSKLTVFLLVVSLPTPE